MKADRKQKGGTAGPLGPLVQLTPEQQEELFEMLSKSTTREVIAKIGAPPPEGWGIATHAITLRRFYHRREYQLLWQEIQAGPDSSADSPETARLMSGGLSSLAPKAI